MATSNVWIPNFLLRFALQNKPRTLWQPEKRLEITTGDYLVGHRLKTGRTRPVLNFQISIDSQNCLASVGVHRKLRATRAHETLWLRAALFPVKTRGGGLLLARYAWHYFQTIGRFEFIKCTVYGPERERERENGRQPLRKRRLLRRRTNI